MYTSFLVLFFWIQVFKIVGNQFQECKSCIENKKDLVLEYRRGGKLNLRFNATQNEITFDEFSTFYSSDCTAISHFLWANHVR
jgi:hypothetical protein